MVAASQRIRSENSGVNSRRFPERVLTMPVVARQSAQNQFTTLKIYHCPIRVWTRAGLILPRSRLRRNSHKSRSPRSCSCPQSLAQKWVAGHGGSWWGREGCLLGRVGVDSLPLFKTGRAQRGPSLGLWEGDALLVLRSPSLVPPQSTGDLGWGRLLTAGPAPATPQGAGGSLRLLGLNLGGRAVRLSSGTAIGCCCGVT